MQNNVFKKRMYAQKKMRSYRKHLEMSQVKIKW